MHYPLLSNGFLYFSSSAAQVWAALMVFQVLLVRDLCLYRDEAQEGFIEEGRGWLGVLLAEENKNHLASWSKALGVDIVPTLVRTAKGDQEAEFKLLRAVSERKLFRDNGVGGAVAGMLYTADELQQRIDGLVSRIDNLAATYPEPQEAFKTGVGALAINLAALAVYSFLDENSVSLIGLLGAVVVSNLALGWRFALHCRRALMCY